MYLLRKVFLVCFVLIIYNIPAQTDNLVLRKEKKVVSENFFLTKKVDVGEIRSSKSCISVKFDYRNRTGKIVKIKAVHKSCGCLEVEYPNQPIKDNEKGFVVVKMNLNGLRGYFERSILVYASNVKPAVLKIKGFAQ